MTQNDYLINQAIMAVQDANQQVTPRRVIAVLQGTHAPLEVIAALLTPLTPAQLDTVSTYNWDTSNFEAVDD